MTLSRTEKVFFWLVPRPVDLVAKGKYYWLGVIAAFVGVGFSPNQSVHCFRDSHDCPNTVLSLIGLSVSFFIIEEMLLQQAKLLWDDLRDIRRDRLLMHNANRALVRCAMSIRAAKCQVIARLSIALMLGLMLGGIEILLLFLVISIHQLIYVLWFKPRAGDHPLRTLFFVSFNMSLRFLAGAMIIAPNSWFAAPLTTLFIFYYAISFGSMSAFWKMEAVYLRENSQTVAMRPQSGYFYTKGLFWQRIGFSVATIFVLISSVSCVSSPSDPDYACSSFIVLQDLAEYFPAVDRQLIWSMLPAIHLVISAGLTVIFQQLGIVTLLLHVLAKVEYIGVVARWLFLVLFSVAILKTDFTLYLASHFAFATTYLVSFEFMTYTHYAQLDRTNHSKKLIAHLFSVYNSQKK